MPVTSLPWIQGADPAGQFARGLQLSQSLAMERNRLAAENQRTQMEFQARKATQDQENQREDARLRQEKAYHDAQIQVQQAKLVDAQKATALKVRNAAAQMAAIHKFAAVNAAHPELSMAEKLAMVPELSTPQAVLRATQIDLEGKNQKMRERQETRLEDELKYKMAKGEAPPHVTHTVTDKQGNPIDKVTGSIGQLQGLFGTNLPPELRAKTAPTSPFREGQKIRNKKTGAQFIIRNGEPVPLSE